MSETKTRVWVELESWPQSGEIFAVASTRGHVPNVIDVSRVFLDIPHGVGLGDEGPVDIVAAAVLAEREKCAAWLIDEADAYRSNGNVVVAAALLEAADDLRRGDD